MAHVIEITDLTSPELKPYAQLTNAQLRSRREPDQGIFIAESAKVISCALNAGCLPLSLLMERRQITASSELLARCRTVPVYTADRAILAQLTGYELTRGILCAMRRPPLPSVEELCQASRRVVVLENITDATNIGAIFRSAAALGMDAVLVTPLLLRPPPPPGHPRQHGDRVPDPLDLDRGGLRPMAPARPLPSEGTWVSYGRHGAAGPLRQH